MQQRRARIRHELLRRARCSECGSKDGGNCYSHLVANAFKSAPSYLSISDMNTPTA
jgi:hypothetical protein